MKKQIFFEIKDKIARYVESRRLRDAFSLARSLSETNMAYEATRDLDRAEESYRLMLSYAAQGAEDPARKEIAAKLGESILSVVDRLQRTVLKTEEPTIYYGVLRFEETRPAETIAHISDDYRKLNNESSLLSMVASGKNGSVERFQTLSRLEALERRLFEKTWVSFPLNGSDCEALRNIIASNSFPSHVRRLLIGAITLGGLEFYDPKRIELLMEAYAFACREDSTTADEAAGLEAVTGLLILLYIWRNRSMSQAMKNRLDAIKELPYWKSDLKDVFMELARTRDTERIANKMRDEILPEMIKLSSDISKKINPDGELNIDPSDIEENPEWAELMENSDLNDKLREMNEIQEQGGDIMIGTFSNFKSFPFFNLVANWFMPFHGERSEFAQDKIMVQLSELLEALPMLCDSDKYSMVLSASRIPAEQHRLILNQLQAQGDQLREMAAASLNLPETKRKNRINKYVQNLYRFFSLFRRKGEFNNPFSEGLNLVAVPALANDLTDYDTLMLVGEFYFSHKYFKEALEIFSALSKIATPDVQLFQKIGYCHQQLGDLSSALGYYENADILAMGQSQWTLKRIGRCRQLLGDYAKALEAYRKLEELQPENAGVALSIGHCLVELGRYEEAVKSYFKAEYLDSKSGKALRPLAWSLLMLKDFEQSRKYYERVIATTNPSAEDYLNMGHLSLADGHFAEALNFYKLNVLSREATNKNNSALSQSERIDGFVEDMHKDSHALNEIGVKSDMIPLIIDSLIYSLD